MEKTKEREHQHKKFAKSKMFPCLHNLIIYLHEQKKSQVK
jgi:hypothetical protein